MVVAGVRVGIGGEDERENLITAHLEVFRDSFQVEHHAASELRSCCIQVDSFYLKLGEKFSEKNFISS